MFFIGIFFAICCKEKPNRHHNHGRAADKARFARREFRKLQKRKLLHTTTRRAPQNPSEPPDFLSSMGWYEKSNLYYKQRNFLDQTPHAEKESKRLQQLQLLYEKNIQVADDFSRKPVIPKIIHQIWLGPKTPPAIFKKSQESIQKLYPDWEYKLWTDADVSHLGLYNQKYYDLSDNFGAKADILRYELLYRYGGIYLDVDFICKKPFDRLLYYDLFVGIQPIDCVAHICNCIIGSIPGQSVLNDCVISLGESWDNDGENNILNMVGPMHFQRSFMKFVDDEGITIIALPTGFFFPLSFKNRYRGLTSLHKKSPNRKIQSLARPETLAIHYWAGSWW